MAPYDAVVTAEMFVEATETFNWLVGQLADPESDALTHSELQELIVTRGREMQRLLLQAQLDLRARREERAVLAARAVGAGLAGADGVVRRRVEIGHRRCLATLAGPVTVTRCAWGAPGAPNLHPADAALSLLPRSHSAGLAVGEAVRGPFDAALVAITARCWKLIGKCQIQGLVVATAADIAVPLVARRPEREPSCSPRPGVGSTSP